MKTERCDLLVVGAGPAGSTLASLVKKYAPERKVILLEREPGPRHHIGESLLPGLVPVLKEMGVFEKVDGAGFPRKIGANYIWGMNREIWENDFNDVNVSQMLARYGALPEKIEYAWQVRRSVYDEILLKHALELGVSVRRGQRAVSITEKSNRVTGAVVEDRSGLQRGFECEFLADCSGQSGFLSRFKRIREYNPSLKNVAAYSYFKGAPWKYRFTGHPDKTKIFICSVSCGWFWYIPVSDEVVSVGLVTATAHVKKNGADLRDIYWKELKACGEIWPLLEGVSPIKDFEGTGKEFFTQSDWSYLNVASSGPGWLAAGDAAVFVDPILSSGVTLAHINAHRAAYTVLTDWKGGDAGRAELLWRDYSVFCRESAAQFLVLALFWYGNDRRTKNWWGRAERIQKAWLPAKLDDHMAFIAVSAGLTRHYERPLSAAVLAEETPLHPEDYPFYMSVLKGKAPKREMASREKLRLSCSYKVEVIFVPAPSSGLLRPVKRVRFLKHEPVDAVSDALNPRRVVTRYHLVLLKCIAGGGTLAKILNDALARGVPEWWVRGRATAFIEELKLQEVLESFPRRGEK